MKEKQNQSSVKKSSNFLTAIKRQNLLENSTVSSQATTKLERIYCINCKLQIKPGLHVSVENALEYHRIHVCKRNIKKPLNLFKENFSFISRNDRCDMMNNIEDYEDIENDMNPLINDFNYDNSEDHDEDEHEDTDNHSEMAEANDDDTSICAETEETNYILELQLNIIKQLQNPEQCFNTSAIKGHRTFWQDFALINNFAIEADLTSKQISKFIDVIQNICVRQTGQQINLPKQYRTIFTNINQSFAAKFYQPMRLLLKLDPKVFFKSSRRDISLNPVEGIIFKFEDVIANAFFEINDVKNFITKPDIIIECGDRVYKDYVTGKQFEEYCSYLNATHTNKNSSLSPAPLCLGLTMDESTANKTRTRSECPVCLYILNVRNQDFKMHLLGYVPTTYPYSDREFHKLLLDRGCKIKSLRENIIKLTKQNILTDFVSLLLKGIKKYEQTGFNVYIGTSTNTKLRVFPKVCLIAGDTAMSDKLNGTNFRLKNMKCRLCKCADISIPRFCSYNDFDYRIWRESLQIGIDAQILLRNELFSHCRDNSYITQSPNYATSENKTRIKNLIKQMSIVPGYNLLHKSLSFESPNFNLSLHTMLVPDILHTFFKGIVEYTIAHTLIILQSVQSLAQKHRKPQFINVLAKLDERVIKFIHKDSFAPTRYVHFRKGVSYLISADSETTTKAHKSSGLLSGSLEGWKLLPLLFQITMSLNMTPLLIPTGWKSIDEDLIGVIMKSLNVVLILSFVISSGCLTESNITNLRRLGKSAVKLMNKLKQLKTKLLNMCTTEDNYKQFTSFRGVKFHLLEHLFAMIPYFGACGRAYDTQISESSHKITVKKLFESTSKRYDSCIYEMGKRWQSYKRNNLLKTILNIDASKPAFKLYNPMEEILLAWPIAQKIIICNNKLILDKQTEKTHMHPFISLDIIQKNLRIFLNNNDSRTEMWQFVNKYLNNNHKYSLELLASIKINGNESTGMKPFIIMCQPSVTKRKNANSCLHQFVSSFSTVEMNFDNSARLYKILAILKFTGPVYDENKRNYYILFVLAEFQEVHPKSQDNYLHFLEYKFAKVNAALKIHIVHSESLTKPSFMISKTNDNYYQLNERLTLFDKYRYYNVSYDQVFPNFQSSFDHLINQEYEDVPFDSSDSEQESL